MVVLYVGAAWVLMAAYIGCDPWHDILHEWNARVGNTPNKVASNCGPGNAVNNIGIS